MRTDGRGGLVKLGVRRRLLSTEEVKLHVFGGSVDCVGIW